MDVFNQKVVRIIEKGERLSVSSFNSSLLWTLITISQLICEWSLKIYYHKTNYFPMIKKVVRKFILKPIFHLPYLFSLRKPSLLVISVTDVSSMFFSYRPLRATMDRVDMYWLTIFAILMVIINLLLHCMKCYVRDKPLGLRSLQVSLQ